MLVEPKRPTKAEIRAAAGKTVPDVIAPGLRLLFIGINPGLYTAAIGHHFGRPGNRFWPVLYLSGFTPRLLSPYEELELLDYGYGITNLVSRATKAADELTREEIVRGGQQLKEKIASYQPRYVAVLGVGAYRSAFKKPKAVIGKQTETLGGASCWVLPNPSGLNAHYDLEGLARLFRELREVVNRRDGFR
ncbi:MAG: G/U mismatch-specific DNA glycosylase [Omnitrophica WOR_2 bacterium]